jgi:hypothetical protein
MTLSAFNVSSGVTSSIITTAPAQYFTISNATSLQLADGGLYRLVKPRRKPNRKVIPEFNPSAMPADLNEPVYYSRYRRFDPKTGKMMEVNFAHPCGEAPEAISHMGKRLWKV